MTMPQSARESLLVLETRLSHIMMLANTTMDIVVIRNRVDNLDQRVNDLASDVMACRQEIKKGLSDLNNTLSTELAKLDRKIDAKNDLTALDQRVNDLASELMAYRQERTEGLSHLNNTLSTELAKLDRKIDALQRRITPALREKGILPY